MTGQDPKNSFNENSDQRLRRGQPGYVADTDSVVDPVSGYTPLISAVLAEDAELVRRILLSGGDPERADIAGETPLHAAVRLRSVPITRLLLAHRANPDALSDARKTPLHLALSDLEAAAELAHALLDGGASVDVTNENGEAALHLAVQRPDDDENNALIDRIITATSNIDVPDDAGMTPVHNICRMGRVALLEKFMALSANLQAVTNKGDTCLHAALEADTFDCAFYLLSGHGIALLNIANKAGELPLHRAVHKRAVPLIGPMLTLGSFINSLDENEHTPLHIAAILDEVEIAQQLLDAGAAFDAQGETYKESALLKAARNGGVRVARLLLSRGAAVDQADDDHVTPLMAAVAGGLYELAAHMLELGANAALTDKSKRNVLHHCAENLPPALLQRLIWAGADLEGKDAELRTPLLKALTLGHVSTAKEVLLADAQVNIQDIFGYTPLLLAIALHNPVLSADLTDRGANPYVAEHANGMTAMHVAALTAQVSEVERLLAAGVPVDIRTKYGFTPLHYAMTQRTFALATVECLLEAGAGIFARTLPVPNKEAGVGYLNDARGFTPIDFAHTYGLDEILKFLRAAVPSKGETYQVVTAPIEPFGKPTPWP